MYNLFKICFITKTLYFMRFIEVLTVIKSFLLALAGVA